MMLPAFAAVPAACCPQLWNVDQYLLSAGCSAINQPAAIALAVSVDGTDRQATFT